MGAEQKKKVRFIKPTNSLKLKAGSGGINDKLLVRAQKTIENAKVDFATLAKKFLEDIDLELNLKQLDLDKEKVINSIMQLKASGGMFGYTLVSEVADIALNFLEAIEGLNDDAKIVVRAHKNAIQIIIKNKLKKTGSQHSEILINELNQACARYIKKYS